MFEPDADDDAGYIGVAEQLVPQICEDVAQNLVAELFPLDCHLRLCSNRKQPHEIRCAMYHGHTWARLSSLPRSSK